MVQQPFHVCYAPGQSPSLARRAGIDFHTSPTRKRGVLRRPPVRVSDELFFVLEKAQELAKRTDGAFDVTVGPIVRLWRFARKAQRLPDPDELKAALPLVGYKNMILDPKAKSVRLLREGMRL